MARENVWGYKRIHGELKKLNITISKTCIANILRRNSLPPSQERKGLTWKEFLSRHAEGFLCADLLTKEIWILRGLCRAFVFFAHWVGMSLERVGFCECAHEERWLKQQARHVLWECEELGIEPRFFLHDNDRCFSDDFDTSLKNTGMEPINTPYEAPNANAFSERWIRGLREECLNHLIILGLDRLQYVLDEFKDFFNQHRPHQRIGNIIPNHLEQKGNDTIPVSNDKHLQPSDIQCQQFPGGLLKSYFRKAA